MTSDNFGFERYRGLVQNNVLKIGAYVSSYDSQNCQFQTDPVGIGLLNWNSACEHVQLNQIKNHFIANTNSVYRSHINMETIGVLKGNPNGTNPAIMGNPINMYRPTVPSQHCNWATVIARMGV